MDLKARWNACAIYLHQGDITAAAVDAVVNAANAGLRGGAGVDGAIHRHGGPTIMAECRRIMEARRTDLGPGEAVITSGGDLPARFVIHTVGPIYDTVTPEQAAQQLADCYRNSLALLRQHGLRSIAFPCISTGAYGYPSAAAGPVALRAVREALQASGGCQELIFCTFTDEDTRVYEEAFARLAS